MEAFRPNLVYGKLPSAKGKDKCTFQCVEWCCKTLYVGYKDGAIEQLILSDGADGGGPRLRDVGKRQMGRSGIISQLKAVAVLNHLLVLWDGSVSVLNMFSLEPATSLKKIQNVSLFHVSEPADQSHVVFAELFTASAKRKTVNIHKVYVDRWECVKQVAVPGDLVALAVHDSCLCVATSDRYFLHDHLSQGTLDIFPHDFGKQNIIAKECGNGEFLVNGPGSLGMFVLKSGISQRPPVQWPEGVLDAVVYFPYVLALRSQAVHVYSMLDQQLKQTVPIHCARGLLSTADHVFAVAEREIWCLSPLTLEGQIQALVGMERVGEALQLLHGVQALLPKDTYKDLLKTITSTSGLLKFYRECFLEAKELFIEGDLDPREIISLFPAISVVCDDFKTQLPCVSNAKNLWTLSQEDRPLFQQYLSFLGGFLRDFRKTAHDVGCCRAIDSALLKLYIEQEEYENLQQLVSCPNDCALPMCVPDLELHKRYFILGLLYQSKGQHFKAVQTWVKIVEGEYADSSCVEVHHHIVNTLRQLKDKDIIWQFADWALQQDQEGGIQIFTKREPDDPLIFAPEEVLTRLTKHPKAVMLYLEFLVYTLNSEEGDHHTLLAKAYVTQILHNTQDSGDNDFNPTQIRNKLQQLLWDSLHYNSVAILERIMTTSLHMEKAILLGRAGKHRKALEILAYEELDQRAAEDYCRRTSAGQKQEFTCFLFFTLLQIYLGSSQHVISAVDLLNNHASAFDLTDVLQVLPASWSIQLVTRFLFESLRGTLHHVRMTELEKGLAKVEHLRHKHLKMKAANGFVRVDRTCICHCCHRLLTKPEFLRIPTGEVIHTCCYKGEKESNNAQT